MLARPHGLRARDLALQDEFDALVLRVTRSGASAWDSVA
jgi:hypothetical protein